jgi:hypothetical protein
MTIITNSLVCFISGSFIAFMISGLIHEDFCPASYIDHLELFPLHWTCIPGTKQ